MTSMSSPSIDFIRKYYCILSRDSTYRMCKKMTEITTANYSKFSLWLLWRGIHSEPREELQHNLPVAVSEDSHFDKQTNKKSLFQIFEAHTSKDQGGTQISPISKQVKFRRTGYRKILT